ncbi:hypothetical protein JNJ66_04825 [Candidatus Saccharibacteria bacterium]|nr:hypothetical protein [Candidatus Saccharibacteria bacterium]
MTPQLISALNTIAQGICDERGLITDVAPALFNLGEPLRTHFHLVQAGVAEKGSPLVLRRHQSIRVEQMFPGHLERFAVCPAGSPSEPFAELERDMILYQFDPHHGGLNTNATLRRYSTTLDPAEPDVAHALDLLAAQLIDINSVEDWLINPEVWPATWGKGRIRLNWQIEHPHDGPLWSALNERALRMSRGLMCLRAVSDPAILEAARFASMETAVAVCHAATPLEPIATVDLTKMAIFGLDYVGAMRYLPESGFARTGPRT